MAERHIVIEKERLNYEGLFNAKELFEIIKSWAADKGYWVVEKIHAESLKPEGKYIELVLDPVFKKLTDYAKSVIKIRIQMSEVKDVTVEIDKRKTKLQEGKIKIVFDGILETDYEHRWEMKPLFYVIRTLWEKYIYTPFISGFEKDIKRDLMKLKDDIKSYLNLAKFRIK
ncbi:hypothetical protein DRJ22_01390 [Candidatus Woesearchaeota archaeon]|nr:MAG: hypothetical protein B6U93_00740 [Candidatus Woesearchaeota archaeon ex4484_78]RLE46655.1 MAG: hypothetical protein DRJ22_01390 [Candidatus Woesearchaeota archaeon]